MKKFISIILSLAMCLSLLPTAALAAEETATVYVAGIEMQDGKYLANDAEALSDTVSDGTGYAYYKDGVLTLDNFLYEGSGYKYTYESEEENLDVYALIYCEGSIEIALTGYSDLLFPTEDTHADCIHYGIEVWNGDLTVSGTGSVDIVAEHGMIAACDEIVDGGNVSFEGGDVNVYADVFAVSCTNVTVSGGSADLYAESGTCVSVLGGVFVTDGHLSAGTSLDEASASELSYAIYAADEVSFTGGDVSVSAYSRGISAANVLIKDCEAEVSSLAENVENAYAIYSRDNVTIGNSIVDAFCESGKGIFAENSVIIDASEVTVYGAGVDAICAKGGDMSVTNSSVTAYADGTVLCAESGSVSISGSVLDTFESVYGIAAEKSLSIEDSVVDITAYTKSLSAKESITIDGSELQLAPADHAVYLSGANGEGITITNSDVAVSRPYSEALDGIIAESGDITVADSFLHIEVCERAISALGGDISITGGSVLIPIFLNEADETALMSLSGISAAGTVCIDGASARIVSGSSAISANAYIVLEDTDIIYPEGAAVKNCEVEGNSYYTILDDTDAVVSNVFIGTDTHEFSDTIAYDEAGHWNICTCGGEDCPLYRNTSWATFYEGSNYEAHTYENGVCSVCGSVEDRNSCDVFVLGIPMASGEYLTNYGYYLSEPVDGFGYAGYQDGVLTLSDFDGDSGSYRCELTYELDVSEDSEPITTTLWSSIFSGSDLEVKLVGTNALPGEDTGIAVLNANLTVSGDGSLDVCGEHAIVNASGELLISGGTLNIKDTYYGIGIESVLGDVIISGGTLNINSYEGVHSEGGNVTVSGGTLNASTGLFGIVIKGGDLTFDGGTENLAGISAENANVAFSGGNVTIDTENIGVDVTNGNVTVSGGTVDITTAYDGIKSTLYSDGVLENAAVTISGGTLSIESLGSGISTSFSVDVVISGGTVDISSVSSDGIWAGNVRFTGSSANVTVRSEESCAVSADSGLSMDSGLKIETPVGGRVANYNYDPSDPVYSYYTVLDADGNPASEVSIVPNTTSDDDSSNNNNNNNNDNGYVGGGDGYSGPVTIPGKQPVTPKPEQPKDETSSVTFSDVPAGAYYADAVKWAVEKGITNGVGGSSFAPNASCTRGQMVTFLYRMAGEPAASGIANFSDVSAGDYYAKAVAWAVEKGITNGTGNGLFSPDAECSRAQMAVFLFRMVGASTTGGASFGDVDAGAYYADAVAWAAANGITTGTGDGNFSPNANCTRGQMVTFLYRCFAE